MTAWRVLPLAAIACLACQPAGRNALTGAHAAAIADSVREVLRQYADDVSGGRWESVIAYYADDTRFHWLENGRRAYSSRGEIEAGLRSLAAVFEVGELTLEDIRVVALAPGVAAASASFRQSLTDTAGTAFSFGGAISVTALHTDSGWKFLNGHTSVESSSGR